MASTCWRIKTDDLPAYFQIQEQRLHQALPEELGKGYSNVYQLDADLNYIETSYTPNKNLSVLSQIDAEEPRMVVTLALMGQSEFIDNRGEQLVFNSGYTSIATFNSSIGERQYHAHQTIKQLRLSVSKNWLDRYFGEQRTAHLFNSKAVQLLSHQPISAPGMMAAQQLLNTQVIPEMQRVFMHAQALSLLAAELTGLYQEKIKFTDRDKAIALLARDILQREFQQPPSVAKLAKQVGVNQFKLKKLFHHFFSNTPYGLLLDIRMNKAYQLLASSHYQVSAVAELVGYQHANNFSVAFSKYFGIPPKALTKQTMLNLNAK